MTLLSRSTHVSSHNGHPVLLIFPPFTPDVPMIHSQTSSLSNPFNQLSCFPLTFCFSFALSLHPFQTSTSSVSHEQFASISESFQTKRDWKWCSRDWRGAETWNYEKIEGKMSDRRRVGRNPEWKKVYSMGQTRTRILKKPNRFICERGPSRNRSCETPQRERLNNNDDNRHNWVRRRG
jgi:hypothetical protein